MCFLTRVNFSRETTTLDLFLGSQQINNTILSNNIRLRDFYIFLHLQSREIEREPKAGSSVIFIQNAS